MNTVLLRFSVKGVKNLSNNTSIDFYKKTIRKNSVIDLKNRRIKAVFGINGAGKTAYISGVRIYKELNIRKDYLVQDEVKRILQNLINKKTKNIELEAIFAFSEKNNIVKEILKHKVIIKEEKDVFGQLFYSVEEILSKQIGSNIDGEYSDIYHVLNGNIEVFDQKLDDIDLICKSFINKLNQSTIISYGADLYNQYFKNSFNKNTILNYIYYTLIFVLSLHAYLDKEDEHKEYCALDFYLQKDKTIDKIKNVTFTIHLNEDLVSKNLLDKYKKDINHLKSFIQVLKPDLLDIKLDQSFDGTFYHMKKIFVYEYGEIDELYESTGIKRIIKLYSFLKKATRGDIVFIDELDANISGVFLDRLLEFFNDNGNGQLCFTTHDILSMNTLKQYKNAIITIGESGKIVPIVKDGHYSPVNQFYEGMIEDSPFNINSFDFLTAFGELK